jgi:hypothetical protein
LYGAETWKLLKADRKCLKVLKYGAGEGWRRSVGPIVWKMKTYLRRVKEERNILQTIKKERLN